MKNKAVLLGTIFSLSLLLNGCSGGGGGGRTEHYVSKKITGEAQRINLEEVQKAFWDTKGKDMNSWMADFEKKVNEIFEGKEVVSIDATRKDGHLTVIGYIDKQNKEGFVAGDEKLFSIEQTGEAANNEMPYRVSGYDDRPYYEGHHSFLSNPFLQAMLISHVMGGFGGRYHTPPQQIIVLRDHRDGFRQTPQYGQQQTANQGFFSRFKSKPSGDLESSRKFGGSGFSSASGTSEKKRSWFGGSSSSSSASSGSSTGSSTSTSSSAWGGRRSSSGSGLFGSSGGSRRSWGGRRR